MAVADPPVQDHAPTAGRRLALLEELGEVGERAADDDEVVGRRTNPRTRAEARPGEAGDS